jgi:ADP-heptose:LPS heptosyltransferase
MHLLLLQLKRIGDLVLTAPAVAALRAHSPGIRITLATTEACSPLVPAIPGVERNLVLPKKGLGADFWKRIAFGNYDACLDFTGTDRSALATLLSGAPQRIGFSGTRQAPLRSMVYTHPVQSQVRDHHTVDHHLHLLGGLKTRPAHGFKEPVEPPLEVPQEASETARSLLGDRPFFVAHAGTARPEKYWVADRWAKVIEQLQQRHGLRCVLTGGRDPFELEHLQRIQEALKQPVLDLSGKLDLPTFAAVIERARLCLSCDTGAVHVAAAFRVPQVALYGPTNPFHWRPRHSNAVVISASSPSEPLRDFSPRMKGAPMSQLDVAVVAEAAHQLLSGPSERAQ